MKNNQHSIKGRGATDNPANRFERLHYEPATPYAEAERPETTFFNDHTSSIITYNQSPDVGFEASINPYRGCEHGCAYCYARPYHEYLGFSAGLDFETKILVKKDAPELLKKELASPKWQPQTLALSGVTDPYQPAERDLQLTRRCLEVIAKFRNPVAIITKNHLITRDIDILKSLAELNAVNVHLSITTLDLQLKNELEPRTSTPEKRLDAIRELNDAGIPAGALIAPVIPGLTDHELPEIIEAVAETGADFVGYILLRLPYNLKDQFSDWLETHFPDRKDKVLNRIRELRSGDLNETEFGTRMRGKGIFAEQINDLFKVGCKKAEISSQAPRLSTAHFRRNAFGQMGLFG